MGMITSAFKLRERLMAVHTRDREWIQGNAIFECIALRDTREGVSISTAEHSVLVAYISYLIAQQYCSSQSDVDRYFLSGLLHDVGKLNMADRILKSSEQMSQEDKETLPAHVIHGVNMLRQLGFGDDVVSYCLFHHEKLDGSGYPRGCKGAEVPLIGRIAAVADVFGAMCYPRRYRPGGFGIPVIFSYLREEEGRFDQDVVSVLELVSSQWLADTSELSFYKFAKIGKGAV
ncbi:HD-GYP domain-containing protein [Paenibacillus sp. GYB003]|uniref:HD-GYP domain-containing protein n=1 Tax=Paenibacillus sp. GYB003 TaxID=2994392 RepID=UPI002F96DD4B